MINFIKGQAYNIELKDTSIMGNNFKNVVCLGEIAGEIAGAYGDVMAGHARMASVVSGLPVNYDDYDYVLFRLTDNSVRAIGLEWIRENSVVSLDMRKIFVEIDNYPVSKIGLITTALKNLGIPEDDINITASS